jgi:hypothetical protein
MRKIMMPLLFLLFVAACKSPSEKWRDSLSGYGQLKDQNLQLEAMKMDSPSDSTVLNYKVRLYPSKLWLEAHGNGAATHFDYGVDSCFTVSTGMGRYRPVFVQPVANGIKNCYEYLISFKADQTIKMKPLWLVYADKYIADDKYTLDLNKH